MYMYIHVPIKKGLEHWCAFVISQGVGQCIQIDIVTGYTANNNNNNNTSTWQCLLSTF